VARESLRKSYDNLRSRKFGKTRGGLRGRGGFLKDTGEGVNGKKIKDQRAGKNKDEFMWEKL